MQLLTVVAYVPGHLQVPGGHKKTGASYRGIDSSATRLSPGETL